MASPLVILDFDGTFTDVEQEGAPFEACFRREFNGLVGRDVTALWEAQARRLLATPEAGWPINGFVVAPFDCDPYIRCTCVADAVLTELQLLPTGELRTMVLNTFYKYAYRSAAEAFRPEAKRVLGALRDLGVALRVITNSDTQLVQAKVRHLGFTDITVIGDAQKYVVDQSTLGDARFDALQPVQVSGLQRALQVRRPRYYEVLKRVWSETGTRPEDTIVCGDIFELDLLLPLALGAQAHLLQRPGLHAYEREALHRFEPRATGSDTLDGLLQRVEALVASRR
jgi:FMN phosphatase YigB (HAD superfamily)